MKNRVWMLSLPIVALFTFAFWVGEQGVDGNLTNRFLRENVFPSVRVVEGWFTNTKFKLRGPQPPKNKIVVVEVDNNSIAQFGRWPWHRDYTAFLIDKVFEAGAKVVGLDIVFSEPDVRVPEALAEELKKAKLGHLVNQFETDLALEATFARHQEKLVTGFTTDLTCQPIYRAGIEECPLEDPEVQAVHPAGFKKFTYDEVKGPKFDILMSPLMSMALLIPNMESYNAVTLHSGYFNAFPDADGYIRRSNLVMMGNGIPYASLPMQMAKLALDEKLGLEFDDRHRVKRVYFAKTGREIPTTPLGVMEVNFRGGSFTFPYVSALELMTDSPTVKVTRGLASIQDEPREAILKDAFVLIGISALGVFDMRAFPFDSNVPGVEGHANILDNLLSGDMIAHGSSSGARIFLFLLMTLGAVGFAFAAQKLEAVPGLILFVAVMAGLSVTDLKLLFANQHNWNTGFLYLELFAIFVVTIAVKYVLEERNKKFVRGAFARYVAPAVVDSILKDPTKLTVGGNKKDLTIMFSDIRSFTTFSEKLDPKVLSNFLNDYLGLMTDIVFEFGGTLDKYIGDAVMAFWGSPLDQPEHALNACKAAAKMQRVLAENQQRYKDTYGIDVNAGIGINSGAVTVGNMGSSRIFAYTVLGDHVNLASRLEGLTKYYAAGVLTTRFTFDMIEGAGLQLPPHRVLDFVKVKGKKKAVELIEVLSQEIPADGLKVFQEARELYSQQKWDEAIAKFELAKKLCAPQSPEGDGPSQMFIDRIRDEMKPNSPGPNWDGSYEMTSK